MRDDDVRSTPVYRHWSNAARSSDAQLCCTLLHNILQKHDTNMCKVKRPQTRMWQSYCPPWFPVSVACLVSSLCDVWWRFSIVYTGTCIQYCNPQSLLNMALELLNAYNGPFPLQFRALGTLSCAMPFSGVKVARFPGSAISGSHRSEKDGDIA